MNQKILRLFLILLPVHVYGQIDTTIDIEQVEIIESPVTNEFSHGSRVEIGASQLEKYEGENFSSIIQRKTNWFVRSYGISGIASLSARGAGSSQNTVLWNGVPINNPMVGQTDLSLLTINNINTVSLSQNSLDNSPGYGTIGGVIALSDGLPASLENLWKANISYASFDNISGSLKFQQNFGKVKYSGSAFYDQGKNNFPFYKIGSDKKYQQKHAAHQIAGVLQNVSFAVGKKQTGSFHFWLQQSEREIPPTTTQSISEAKQWDRHGRFLYSHKIAGRNKTTNLSFAYLNEFLRYKDGQIAIDDTSTFERIFMDVNQVRYINPQHKLEWSLRFSENTASAPAYQQKNKASLLTSQLNYTRNLYKQSLKLTFGHQMIDFDNHQLIPAISYIKRWNSGFNINLIVQRNFRNPGLNDRYWIPGGNPNLKAEHGWVELARLAYKPINQASENEFSFSMDLFHRYINDWILWAVSDNGPFYYASNIAVVRSYGAEMRAGVSHPLSNGVLDILLSYQYVRSRNEKAIDLPKIETGQQLFYVPLHQASLQFQYYRDSWSVELLNHYTTESTGINENIPAFFIGDIHIKKFINISTFQTSLGFYIKNFTNANYRLIERRPMPGRNVGIRFTINRKHN